MRKQILPIPTAARFSALFVIFGFVIAFGFFNFIAPATAQQPPTAMDVTQPGDPVIALPSGDSPAGEEVANAIDNTTDKYLNFNGAGSGFSVTPSQGASIVKALRLYTANDAIGRDPASYVLEGSNSSGDGEPIFTMIASGSLALPAGRNRTGQPLTTPNLFSQVVAFDNTTSYTTYRLTFPTIKGDDGETIFQIGEVEFLDNAPPPPVDDFTMIAVNSTSETDVCDADTCTLRGAINRANADAGIETITFNFPDDGTVRTFIVTSSLPVITDAVIIDGYTQSGASANTNDLRSSSGNNAVIRIEIVGRGKISPANGLVIAQSGGGTTLRGIAVSGFFDNQILINGSSNNVVAGCFIGTRADGTTSGSVSGFGEVTGVAIIVAADTASRFNNIGGDGAAASHNLVSGNTTGVFIDGGSTRNGIRGNYIGTDRTGAIALPNASTGLSILSLPNDLSNNIISGNSGNGITFGAIPSSTPTKVTTDQPSQAVTAPATPQTTSRTNRATPNSLVRQTLKSRSERRASGIKPQGLGRSVLIIGGNFIGTTADGTGALGNSDDGIFVSSTDNTDFIVIGSSFFFGGAPNVIANNGGNGIQFNSSNSSTLVASNQIRDNGVSGVSINNASVFGKGGNRIVIGEPPFDFSEITTGLPQPDGGMQPFFSNFIGGNGGDGILINNSSGHVAQANAIGFANNDGITPDPNMGAGIRLINGSDFTLIGASTPGTREEGNRIANNNQSGIVVTNGTNNRISTNSIFSNGGLGIDLNDDGVTPNDSDDTTTPEPDPDADSGANDLQNFPIIVAAFQDGTTIRGSLNSTPNTSFTLEFFYTVGGSAQTAEGETFIGANNVTTDSDGNAAFVFTFSDETAPAGSFITATATDPNGNTSEFSTNPMPTADDLIISGRVTTARHAPLALVTVRLNGSLQSIAMTDSDGRYSFIVPAGGLYTVSVSRPGFTFASPTRNFGGSITANQTADFTAQTKGRAFRSPRQR